MLSERSLIQKVTHFIVLPVEKIQTKQIIDRQKLLGGQSGQYLLNAWGFLPGQPCMEGVWGSAKSNRAVTAEHYGYTKCLIHLKMINFM